MKILHIFIVLVLTIKQFYCLEPDDFCKKDTKKIKICLSYDCGTKFCTFDKETCENFISWGILLKKWIKQPKVYKTFIEKINNCKQNDYRNQWSHRFNFG